MSKYSELYFSVVKEGMAPEIQLNTSIPGESVDGLASRIMSGKFDLSKVLDNASHSWLSIPKINSIALNRVLKPTVISGARANLTKTMGDLEKVNPGDLRQFIKMNPSVFNQASNITPSTTIS